jgi:hypothetical protein
MSDEHFTVDGTLIEAWASHKSFQRKDGDEKPGTGGSAISMARSGLTTRTSPKPIRKLVCTRRQRVKRRS